MKKLRKRYLPNGWYPSDAKECGKQVELLIEKAKIRKSFLECRTAGILPHAGWFFSADIAARVLYNFINVKPDIIVVYGGHLSDSDTPLIVAEDAWETPLGEIEIDGTYTRELKKAAGLDYDKYPDNTIEVQLPIIKFLYPGTKLLALRLPSSQAGVQAAEKVTECLTGKKINFITIGSTDLTHYGENYGFKSQGEGQNAVDWVKNVNDKDFINFALKMDAAGLIEHANSNGSACSAGAAAGAVTAAKMRGVRIGKLLEYKTSYDVVPGDSFVGYAGMVF